jgi:gliding motility-associated-like protein
MKVNYSFSLKFSLLSLFLLTTMLIGLRAQTSISIGTGTTGNGSTSYPCPIQDYYEGSRAQFLYSASDLTAAGMGPGNISAIRFTVTALNGADVSENYRLKIGGTAVTTLSTTTWETISSASTYGPVNYQPVVGTNTFNLSSPFFWNGTDNIIIEVCNGADNTTGQTYSNNPTIPWTTGVSYNCSHTRRDDNIDSYCSNSTGVIENGGGATTTRPNITFQWTPAAVCTGTPVAGSITASVTSGCAGVPFTLTASGVTVATGLTYQWETSTDNINWTPIANSNALSITTAATTGGTIYYRFKVTCSGSGASATSAALTFNSRPLVHGTFTIDNTAPIPLPANTFKTFNDAYAYLSCGVDGPVVFNVINGPYNEQLTVGKVNGASATNTITFKGNGTAAIGFASSSNNERAVLKLNNAGYFIFDSLIINANTGTYGYGVQFLNNSDSNIVRNCTINSSLTATTNNFAGIVMSGSATDPVNAGATLCDFNIIRNNTINGGFYGITSVATQAGACGNNQYTGNRILDFYQYGFYITRSYLSTIEGNYIARPTRTVLTNFYGIYFNDVSTQMLVSKNKILNAFGGAPVSTSTFYGIAFNNADAIAGVENQVINNVIAATNGNGPVYAISNESSDGAWYFHNTIAIDSAPSTSTQLARGFHVGTAAANLFFYDNLISIKRGGNGTKHCIYITNSGTSIASDYNNFFINAPAGNNYLGYYNGNRTNLLQWRAATAGDAASVSVDPVFVDPGVANYKPQNAGFDNKGIYLDVPTDIENTVRSQTTPDMGAYEFIPPPCVTPPTAGVTVFNTITFGDTAVCEGVIMPLGLVGNSFGLTQTFQWQTSATQNGTFSNLGNALSSPDTVIIVGGATLYYRCAVTCGTSTVYSNPIKINVSNRLPGGNYTIASGGGNTWVYPATTGNFNSFNDAKAAMTCGITGPVVFNVLSGNTAGVYNEQLKLDTIPGTNAVNTVTFKGNGNRIAFSSNAANEKAVIKLTHTNNIIFDSLVVDATGSGGQGVGIHLVNNADSITIQNCTILLPPAAINTNFIGILVNGSDNNSIAQANANCDGNKFIKDSITGGYAGILMLANTTATIKDNQVTNCKIRDFYSHGVYLGPGNANTLIESNDIARPTRDAGPAVIYGIYLTGANSASVLVSKNRIHNMMDGMPTATNSTYGITHDNADATSGTTHRVINNLLDHFTGNGVIYGLNNNGSDYVTYYHNTVAVEDQGNTPASVSRNFSQTTAANGLLFKNNMLTNTRGGNGQKFLVYLASGTSTLIEADYNNYFIDSNSTTSFIGYYNSNIAKFGAWKTASAQDANSWNLEPGYQNPAASLYIPGSAPLDNRGAALGITTDIRNVVRNSSRPDIGAFEFTVPNCSLPTTAPTATVTPNIGLCVETPIELDIPGFGSATGLRYVWQTAAAATGPWSNISDSLYFPKFKTGALATSYFRCQIICNGSVAYSTVVTVTMNQLLLAGTYTIDNTQPTSWYTNPVPGSNFNTFREAVTVMSCGISGPIVFNVKDVTFNEQVTIKRVPGLSSVNNVIFQGNPANTGAAIVTYAPSRTDSNWTVKFDSCSYITFRNLTLNSTGTTFSRVIEFGTTAGFDNLISCKVNTPATTSTATANAAVFSNALKATNNVIKGNTITGGYAGIYLSGTSATNLALNHFIDSNTVSGSYVYGIYVSNTNRGRIAQNMVAMNGTLAGTAYGIYANHVDSAYRILKNKVTIDNTTTTVYGLYNINCVAAAGDSGIVAGNTILASTGNTGSIYGLTNYVATNNNTVNNVVAIASSGALAYGLYSFNNTSINYYNNSISISSTGVNTYAAYINHNAAAFSGINIRNNIFANKGGGRALYVNNASFFNGNYNMLYTSGTNLVQSVTPAGNYTSLGAWSNASLWDINSIVYEPAFVNNTDLQPNLANPDVWAMHGRGVQIVGNNYDFNNNVRPVELKQGVPDLGAYEFYPTALPTILTAIPATPAPNATQSFMYGSDTVMKLTWGATAPAAINVRRYSGVVPRNLPVGMDSMFFYTQVEIPGGTGNYPYSIQQFYINPWQGSIPDQRQLGLGKTTASNAWVVGFNSGVNATKKIISEGSLNFMDKFTGLVNPYAPPVLPDSDSSNVGKRFWVAYPVNYYGIGDNSKWMYIYLGALSQNANVTVKVNGTTWVRNYTVPAGRVVSTEIMPQTPAASAAESAYIDAPGLSDRGISIESDEPIVAYAHVTGAQSSGASMLLPVGVWGYEYKMLGITQNYGGRAWSYYYVVADNDNTKIEITSAPGIALQGSTGITPGVPSYVTLNKGQVFQVIASGTTTELTGSTVRSVANEQGKCYPIAMFSGSSRTGINQTGCSTGGDFIMQQNFPNQAWGQKYITAPTIPSNSQTNNQNNIFRILVKDPTTIVKRNNVQIPIASLVSNTYYQYSSNTADYIEADKPIVVAQFMAGYCTGVGDPEMFYLSPLEQGIKSVGFYRNTEQAIDANALTMIIPTPGIASLQIRDQFGGLVTDYSTYPVTNKPGYSVVNKLWATSAKAQVTVVSDSAFTGITYGLGSVESYGYNIGTLVKSLKAQSNINNDLNTSGQTTQYTCVNAPFSVTALLPVQPDSLIWQYGSTPNFNFYVAPPGAPNQAQVPDTAVKNPVPFASVYMNGQTYYKFKIDTSYIFKTPGIKSIKIKYFSQDIESCDHSREDVIYVQVLPAPQTNFDITFNGCEGQTASFAGGAQTSNGLNISQWSWTFHDGSTATGQNATFTYPAAGTYNVTLHTLIPDGCLGDSVKQVVVNPRPVVNVVADTVRACAGNQAQMQVASPQTGVTYNWYTVATGGTAVATNTATYTVTAAAGTTEYYVEGISSAGCVSVARKKVVVTVYNALAQPVPTVTVNTANNTMTVTWPAVAGAVSYQISVNGGTTYTPVTPAGSTTYTTATLQPLTSLSFLVQALAVNSCQTSTSAPVAGCLNNVVPVVTDSFSVCTGSPVTYNVQSPVTGVTYNWYTTATGGSPVFTGTAYTVTVTGPVTFYVEGVGNAGCTSASRKRVVAVLFNTLAQPVPTVTNVNTTNNTIAYSWPAVTGAVSYQVSVNGGAYTSVGTATTYTATGLQPLSTVTLTVQAVGPQTCQTSTSAVISQCLNNTVAISPVSVDICTGGSATFTVQSPVATATYTWYSVANAGTALATGTSYTASNVTTATNLYVQGTGSTGCTSATRTQATINLLQTLAVPVVTLNTSATTATSLTFNWLSIAGATGYEVSIGGGTFISVGSATTYVINNLRPSQTVCIVVRALGPNSCQNSLSTSVCGTTLSNAYFVANAFTPNGDGLNDVFKVDGPGVKAVQMAIFNQWGEKIFETTTPGTGWDGRYKGKAQPSGVYMYVAKITLQDGTIVDKKGAVNLIR